MIDIKNETRFQKREDLVSAAMDEETVMMDIFTGKYYKLSEVGTSIWNLLQKEISFQEMIDALLLEYKISREQCVSETGKYMQTLVEKGIVTVVD